MLAALALLELMPAPGRARPAPAAPLPEWLAGALRGAPATPAGAAAYVLHDERVVEVPAQGRTRSTLRHVVRIASVRGAEAAAVHVVYTRGTSEVTGFRAWTLAADGHELRHWEQRDAIDVAEVGEGLLYSDLRERTLADTDVQPGQLFAWEVVIAEDPLFAQWDWSPGAAYPCARSRFELHLPEGLQAHEHTSDPALGPGQHAHGVWSWERRDQPGPTADALAPATPEAALWVQAEPATGTASSAGIAFADWASVSRWVSGLAAPQGEVTEPLRGAAAGLASGIGDSLARIRAIAAYVQRLNYVAIELNLGRGGGYRPNAAERVLHEGYGDCKDKANLLRTMLRATGVDAELALVSSRGRDAIDSAWATPAQFDHCIVAIRMPRDWRGPALEGGRGARWLPFDPTDPLTPLGDLPRFEQGAWALLVRPEHGALVRLPVVSTEHDRLERRIDATLSRAGALEATLTERSCGQCAREDRGLCRGKRAEYQSVLEEWLPTQGGNVSVREWTAHEDSVSGDCRLQVGFASPSFAAPVGDRMLTFRSALLSPRQSWMPDDSARTRPIALSAVCELETLVVRLPDGFAVDEQPSDVHALNALGRLDATWSAGPGTLTLTRRWELSPVTIGPERWADVRSLYRARRASNEATVVLLRR
jgi:hypothetical protein